MAISIVFTLIGGIIGWNIHEFGGFVLGAAVGYSLACEQRLRNRLILLEQTVRELKEQLREAVVPSSAVRAPETLESASEAAAHGAGAKETPAEAVTSVSTGRERPLPDAAEPAVSDPWAPSGPPLSRPSPPGPLASFFTAVKQAVTNWLTSGNLLVKVGILVLFVGVGFLVRYAAERQVLPIEVRLTAVALGAMGLLAVGWRLRHRRTAYALVLQGGGVAVLYLTVFAALRLYGLLPPPLAFALLLGLAALSAALAVLQDARILASMGTAGGFAAPLLASTGQGSHVMLFSYYAVLNLGVVGIAWFKTWRELNLIGFLFTFAIGTAWGVLSYNTTHFATTEPFLILFFLLYVIVGILFALRQPPRLRGAVDGTLIFGLPIIAFTLQTGLLRPYPYGIAWSALALGLFYVATAWLLFVKAPPGLRLLTEAFLAIGVAFGTLAIPLALDNRWTAAAWAMEGAALVWVGVRQERRLARAAGMLLQVGAGMAFLIRMPGTVDGWPVLNGPYLGGLAVSLAGLFSAWTLSRHRERIGAWEILLGNVLAVWGLFWWLGAGLGEIENHVPPGFRLGATLFFLTLSALVCDDLRVRLSWTLLGFPALALPPALLLMALKILGERGHPFQNGGGWGWAPGFAACIWLLWRQERQPAFPGRHGFLHPLSLWLFVWVITWEISHQTGRWITGTQTWALAAWGFVPVLAVLALTLEGRRLSWPVIRYRKEIVLWGCGPLCLFVWLWLLASSFGSDGSPYPLPYLPLLNPLDVTAGLAFATFALWALHMRREFPEEAAPLARSPWSRIVPCVYGGSVFVWLNAILARTLHHWAGMGFSSRALFRSVLFQASLSILWSFTALCLMVFATRHKLRSLWLAGGGLLGVVVLKLFLIDLAKTGTVERIVSFISVGILILVVGYFSPVPPRRKEESEQS